MDKKRDEISADYGLYLSILNICTRHGISAKTALDALKAVESTLMKVESNLMKAEGGHRV